MKLVNAGIGLLVLIFLAAIFLPMYMTTILASNQTGWGTTLPNILNNYLPLLAGVGIVVLIVYMAFIRGKS